MLESGGVRPEKRRGSRLWPALGVSVNLPNQPSKAGESLGVHGECLPPGVYPPFLEGKGRMLTSDHAYAQLVEVR